MKEMICLARALRDLKNKKSQINDKLKLINNTIEENEAKLTELMINEDVQNFNVNDTMFYLISKPLANVKSADKETFFKALNDQGYGDLIKQTVNHNTLNAFVRDQIENHEGNLPEWINGLVSVYVKNSVGMRNKK